MVKAVSTKQLAVLQIIYRFRFVSLALLSEALGIANTSPLYRKVHILVRAGYVGKRYDKSYKLAGKPASYYLTPAGIKALAAATSDASIGAAVREAYRDKLASEAFIAHQHTVMAVALRLQATYPTMNVYTKRQLVGYDNFPHPLPDLFLSLHSNATVSRYFVEVFDDTYQAIQIDKPIRRYADFIDDDTWTETGVPFPHILLICGSPRIEKRAQKMAEKYLSSELDESQVLTTSVAAILTKDAHIWSPVDEPEQLVSLLDV